MGEKEIKGTIFLTSLLRSDGAGHLPSPVELLATLPMPAVTNHITIVAESIYISTNSARGLAFIHILSSTHCL